MKTDLIIELSQLKISKRHDNFFSHLRKALWAKFCLINCIIPIKIFKNRIK